MPQQQLPVSNGLLSCNQMAADCKPLILSAACLKLKTKGGSHPAWVSQVGFKLENLTVMLSVLLTSCGAHSESLTDPVLHSFFLHPAF